MRVYTLYSLIRDKYRSKIHKERIHSKASSHKTFLSNFKDKLSIRQSLADTEIIPFTNSLCSTDLPTSISYNLLQESVKIHHENFGTSTHLDFQTQRLTNNHDVTNAALRP